MSKVEVPCSLCRQVRPVAVVLNYGPDHWPLGVPPGLHALEPLCQECADLLMPAPAKPEAPP